MRAVPPSGGSAEGVAEAPVGPVFPLNGRCCKVRNRYQLAYSPMAPQPAYGGGPLLQPGDSSSTQSDTPQDSRSCRDAVAVANPSSVYELEQFLFLQLADDLKKDPGSVYLYLTEVDLGLLAKGLPEGLPLRVPTIGVPQEDGQLLPLALMLTQEFLTTGAVTGFGRSPQVLATGESTDVEDVQLPSQAPPAQFVMDVTRTHTWDWAFDPEAECWRYTILCANENRVTATITETTAPGLFSYLVTESSDDWPDSYRPMNARGSVYGFAEAKQVVATAALGLAYQHEGVALRTKEGDPISLERLGEFLRLSTEPYEVYPDSGVYPADESASAADRAAE